MCSNLFCIITVCSTIHMDLGKVIPHYQDLLMKKAHQLHWHRGLSSMVKVSRQLMYVTYLCIIHSYNFTMQNNVRYWPHATSHSQASTCEYLPKMGEPLQDTASACAHQSLCATEFRVCTCT